MSQENANKCSGDTIGGALLYLAQRSEIDTGHDSGSKPWKASGSWENLEELEFSQD